MCGECFEHSYPVAVLFCLTKGLYRKKSQKSSAERKNDKILNPRRLHFFRLFDILVSKYENARTEETTMALQLENGRPSDTTGRLPKEIAVYDLLDSLKIPYQRVDHEAAFTMEACAEVDKVLAPAVVCKNLLLCNSQKTSFYLLMIREDKKFKTKEISSQIGSARLSFAPEEYMEKFLNVTPGSVTVMGLMNDTENEVRLLIDEDVLKSELFGCHPCINTSSLRLSVHDLITVFLPAVKHDYTKVTLAGEE